MIAVSLTHSDYCGFLAVDLSCAQAQVRSPVVDMVVFLGLGVEGECDLTFLYNSPRSWIGSSRLSREDSRLSRDDSH